MGQGRERKDDDKDGGCTKMGGDEDGDEGENRMLTKCC